MFSTACSNEEKVKITVAPKTTSGHAAQLDGPLRVTVQSGDGTVTQDATEPHAFFAVSGDVPGTTVYLVEGDADLGAGTTLLQETVELVVAGANAVQLGVTAGAPEPK